MDWNRAKNVIILLLVIVNVFLLCTIGTRAYQNAASARSNASELIAYLGARGIEMDAEALPEENLGRTVMVSVRDAEAEAAFARALLGEAELEANEDGFYAAAGGTLTIRFGGYLEAYLRERTEDSSLSALLEESGIELSQKTSSGGGAGMQVAYAGYPVFNCSLTASYGDGFQNVSGRVCVGHIMRTDAETERDASGLLIGLTERMNASGVTRIIKIEPGWVAGSVSNVGISLTPTYHVTTDAGDYYVNAVNGTLIGVE